MILKNVTKFYQ